MDDNTTLKFIYACSRCAFHWISKSDYRKRCPKCGKSLMKKYVDHVDSEGETVISENYYDYADRKQ